jgi:DMSO/TMAO reductase YedYZ molybdopterin-dependent catalytic subunit
VVAQRLFYRPTHRAKEFPRSLAQDPRNNYKGATPIVDLAAWKLTLTGLDGDTAKTLTLADLKDLPRAEQTTELKCIEGWSTIVNWSGVRFIDFAKKYAPPTGTRYVSMLSEPADYPDERYYIGLHLSDCLHPQTLLATHMNGKPLGPEHGAPLRLVIPHKYGIKNIKLITHIAYATERPTDYWFEQGYDWYAGL